MPLFRDQLNREIDLPSVPQRIISVVPSQTELLFYLGLDDRIIGITKFCIHPADKVKKVVKIGGTKQLDIAKIASLKPDLIIANKEENERSQVDELMNICPVWISDISNLTEAMDMVERVGVLTGKTAEAKNLTETIIRQFNNVMIKASGKRAVYLIWRKPYMAAGKGTFIDDMLQKCGFINAVTQERYPEIDAETLKNLNPDIILLSSEPYPFGEKHAEEFKAITPHAKIKLVDGEMFSWYGSRLLWAPEYLSLVGSEL